MSKIWKMLSQSGIIKRVTPRWIKSLVRRNISVLDYDKQIWATQNPYRDVEFWVPEGKSTPHTLGIIHEMTHSYHHYITACREMQIAYKIIDISRNDWIEAVLNSGCEGFLVWPPANLTIFKQMFDERLKILVDDLGKIIYPGYKELWIYESKRRMRDWLLANQIPHPKTDIYYNPEQAISFVEKSDFPLVLKLNQGSSSHGTIILRNSKHAKKAIHKIFNKGLIADRGDKRDRQWGSLIFQEYLPDVREWRMVRIADSYFGHPKGRTGEFHSGSGKVFWDRPPDELLDFLKHVTDRGNFTSMDVDVFETHDGKYMVNELQTVFGASYSVDQARLNGKAGRFIYDSDSSNWKFEAGDFARNACCNLRIKQLLNELR